MWSILLFASLVGLSQTASSDLPPTITNQPKAGVLLYDIKPFRLFCEGSGSSELSFHWRKNGKLLDVRSDSNRISQLIGGGTLTFLQPSADHQGTYQCFVMNHLGIATSNSVYLERFHLDDYPDQTATTMMVNEGESLTLPCKFPARASKLFTVKWFLESSDGSLRHLEESPRLSMDSQSNLYFTNVTREDGDEQFIYVCIAVTKLKKLIRGNRIALNVNPNGGVFLSQRREPIPLHRSRKYEVGLRGGEVHLQCVYGGLPIPQVVWTRGRGIPIELSDRVVLEDYGRVLKMKNATFEDEQYYTCDVSNGVGRSDEYTIWLRIKAAPYFLAEPKNWNVTNGTRVQFHCEAHGIPPPTIVWTRNGAPISDNETFIVEHYSLIIENAEITDAGNFGCNASSSLGYVYKDFYLQVNTVDIPYLQN